jgi:hypothetical protein
METTGLTAPLFIIADMKLSYSSLDRHHWVDCTAVGKSNANTVGGCDHISSTSGDNAGSSGNCVCAAADGSSVDFYGGHI